MVLRDGMLVEGQVSDVTTDDLARFMVGHEIVIQQKGSQQELGEEVLRVENLSHRSAFRNVSFSVRSGNPQFTGLLGDGRSELFQAIFGADEYVSGRIFLKAGRVRVRNKP